MSGLLEFFLFLLLLVIALALYGFFVVFPAFLFWIDEQGAVAVAYFCLSNLLVYISGQLDVLRRAVKESNVAK